MFPRGFIVYTGVMNVSVQYRTHFQNPNGSVSAQKLLRHRVLSDDCIKAKTMELEAKHP